MSAAAEKKPGGKPRKRSMNELLLFIGGLQDQCKMKAGPHRGEVADEAALFLTRDDVEALDQVAESLNFLHLHWQRTTRPGPSRGRK